MRLLMICFFVSFLLFFGILNRQDPADGEIQACAITSLLMLCLSLAYAEKEWEGLFKWIIVLLLVFPMSPGVVVGICGGWGMGSYRPRS